MADIKRLTAGEIMGRNLISARPDQPLSDLEHTLIEHNISGVPVIDAGRLVGIVSRSDIARVQVLGQVLDSQISDELHWDETQADGFRHSEGESFESFQDRVKRFKVRDVMRSQVVTCSAETPVADVARLLVRHHIHRVIVTDGERPVGIISSLDIARLVSQS